MFVTRQLFMFASISYNKIRRFYNQYLKQLSTFCQCKFNLFNFTEEIHRVVFKLFYNCRLSVLFFSSVPKMFSLKKLCI